MNLTRHATVALVLAAVVAEAKTYPEYPVRNAREYATHQISNDDVVAIEPVFIAPRASWTVLLYETGDYFLKTMAVLDGTDPLYQKGRPFRVYIGNDGVSVITMTFSIVESAVPQVAGGQEISRREYGV